jgi:hypothetical protein
MDVLYVRSHGFDISHTIAPKDVRQGGLGRIESLRKKRIRGVERGIPHFEQNLCRPGLRFPHLAKPQSFNPIIGVHQPGAHRISVL